MITTAAKCLTPIAIALLLGACATNLRSVQLGEPVPPELVPGKIFVPDVSTTANVGEVMLTAGEFTREATASRIEAFIVDKGTQVQIAHRAKVFEFSVPEGDYRLHSRTPAGSYYSAPKPFSAENDDTSTGYGGLFVPNGSSVATDLYWNWRPDVLDRHLATLTSPINGRIGESLIRLNDHASSGPRATLTYAGVATGQVRFVYKEFTADGLARPAFTQEVSLDYTPGGTYAYKDALFTVESADSTHIRYTLLRPL